MAAGHNKRESVIGAIGWIGVIGVLLAYALVSLSILPAQSIWYQLLNLSAALCICIETWSKRDYQPFWLNVIWGVIAAIALVRLFIA